MQKIIITLIIIVTLLGYIKIQNLENKITILEEQIEAQDNLSSSEDNICDILTSIASERAIIADYMLKNGWDNPYSDKYGKWVMNPLLNNLELSKKCTTK